MDRADREEAVWILRFRLYARFGEVIHGIKEGESERMTSLRLLRLAAELVDAATDGWEDQ